MMKTDGGPMSLTLDDVRRIAGEVAHDENPNVQVVAAIPAGGDSARYAEVLLTLHGCHREPPPCRIVVGVNRDPSEAEFRGSVRDSVREHFADPARAPHVAESS